MAHASEAVVTVRAPAEIFMPKSPDSPFRHGKVPSPARKTPQQPSLATAIRPNK